MNVYLEVLGYLGTALIILSMAMRSVSRLRLFNLCGSAVSLLYAVLTATWPVAVLNICLILINLYHLLRERTHRPRA